MEVFHAEAGEQEGGQSNWKSKNETEENNMEQTTMAKTGSSCIHIVGVQMTIKWMDTGPTASQAMDRECRPPGVHIVHGYHPKPNQTRERGSRESASGSHGGQ